MTIFIIDQNIDGLMCALYKSFTEKIYPCKVYGAHVYQPELCTNTVRVKTDRSNVERVKKALINYGGDNIVYQLRVCLLSCDANAAYHAFCYAHKTLTERRNVSEDLCDIFVSNFFDTLRKVYNEKHRMNGFLRFSETAGGVLYAQYSPDNDITELIVPHFSDRLHDIPFVIHDIKRNRVAVSDGRTVKYGYTDLSAKINPSRNEEAFALLWKRYFNTVNIPERKNTRQQDNYMPRRYRKYMNETY